MAVWSKLPEVVPYLNPADVGVAEAPEKEPDRVAPVELTPLGELAVVTDAVGCCPPAPPPDAVHLVPTTLISSKRMVQALVGVCLKIKVRD